MSRRRDRRDYRNAPRRAPLPPRVSTRVSGQDEAFTGVSGRVRRDHFHAPHFATHPPPMVTRVSGQDEAFTGVVGKGSGEDMKRE